MAVISDNKVKVTKGGAGEALGSRWMVGVAEEPGGQGRKDLQCTYTESTNTESSDRGWNQIATVHFPS